jgi:cytochrome c553
MRYFVLAALSFALLSAQDTSADPAFFESRVRPVLVAKCAGCHGAQRQFSGLRLDTRESWEKGGQRGPARETVLAAVRHEGALKMPPGGKLTGPELEAIEKWAAGGYVWPATQAVAAAARTGHWAFQPLVKRAPKAVDVFLREAREAKGLRPQLRAGKRALARRAAFVLTGLPPEEALLTRFLEDGTAAAWGRYVDSLLASPHYGERWARHWMDLMRFAETYGYEWNYEIHGAWRYRDYLIRAFNADLPYDRFVREHVAGDLLAEPRRWQGQNESALATAFYRLGEMGHDNCNQFPEIRTDVVDNQIDTLTKAFQGLTVSCARCHDHKFDPIPTEDYYSLYGILNSARPVTRTLNTRPAHGLDGVKQAIRAELARVWRDDARDITRHWPALLERKEIDWSDPVYAIVHPEARAQYPAEMAARNAVRPAFDFSKGLPPGWSVDGLGLERAGSGSFSVATGGDAAVEGVYQAGLATNLVSDRWNGTLRSPVLPRDRKYITFALGGGRAAAHRVVMDHCVIGEDHKLIGNARLHLERVPTRNDQPLPTYVELNTVTDNPRLPERPGKFKPNPEEGQGRSWFVVTRAYLHDDEAGPKPSLDHLAGYLEKEPTQARVEEFLGAAIERWAAGQATDADAAWLSWALDNGLLRNRRDATPELARLVDEYRTMEKGLPGPVVAHGMSDLDAGADYPILQSGQARQPGRVAPRHFLSLLPEKLRAVDTRQSGRREMAEAIADAANPLTARVYVNRVWHHVFGRGIVASTDNFGTLSDPPSHPELLDHLALEFMRNGWSTKWLLRELLLTEAFQQASRAEAKAREVDPENRYQHHYPVRRLEAEAVRDAVLAASGRLDRTLFGESIAPHRQEPTAHRRLFQGPLDGNGRRSIYLKITRMEGPRFLETFDFPAPLQTRGNRDVTNVPSQALAMWNDPFVHQQARVWAEELVRRRDDTVDARLTAMFLRALGREPVAAELARYRALIGTLGGADLESVTLWQRVAHTLFNSKEFLYLP